MKDNIITNKYNGFFLIELLVTLVIIQILFLFIAYFQVSISDQKYEIDQYRQALGIISSITEEISAFRLLDKKIKIGDFNILIEDLIKRDSISENGQSKKSFILKNISISWNTLKGKERRISLVSGFIL